MGEPYVPTSTAQDKQGRPEKNWGYSKIPPANNLSGLPAFIQQIPWIPKS